MAGAFRRSGWAWATMSRYCPQVTSVRMASTIGSARSSAVWSSPAPCSIWADHITSRSPSRIAPALPKAAESPSQPALACSASNWRWAAGRPAPQVGGVHHVVVDQGAAVQHVEAGRRGQQLRCRSWSGGSPAAAT